MTRERGKGVIYSRGKPLSKPESIIRPMPVLMQIKLRVPSQNQGSPSGEAL